MWDLFGNHIVGFPARQLISVRCCHTNHFDTEKCPISTAGLVCLVQLRLNIQATTQENWSEGFPTMLPVQLQKMDRSLRRRGIVLSVY